MRIATRNDPDFQKFMDLAGTIGLDNIQSMFGRSAYCDIVNPVTLPESQVFWLRPAKAAELAQFNSRVTNDPGALGELKALAKTAFPQKLADFRITINDQSQAFLTNIYGEKSALRNIDYYLPRSLATMRVHCLSLGNYTWLGLLKMIEPFFQFCSETSLS